MFCTSHLLHSRIQFLYLHHHINASLLTCTSTSSPLPLQIKHGQMNLIEQNKTIGTGKKYPNHACKKAPKSSQRTNTCKGTMHFRTSRGHCNPEGCLGPYCSVFSVFPSSFSEAKAVDLGQRQAAEQAGLCSDLTEPVLYSCDSKQSQRVQATVIQSCLSQVGRHEETTGQARAKISIM